MEIVCFTDGSAINNGKPNAKASYAVIFPEYPEFNAASIIPGNIHTNNRGEYHAIIKAFEQANIIDPSHNQLLKIYTDSMLAINSLTLWMKAWKQNNWTKQGGDPVANQDLLCILDGFLESRKVNFVHVKAHTRDKTYEANFNRQVDIMAKNALN